MKRIISLFLLASVLVCCLAVPSYAAEFEKDSLTINWLDYCTVNDSGSNYVSLTSNAGKFTYNLPYKERLYATEIVVKLSGNTDRVTSLVVIDEDNNQYLATKHFIGSGYYRFVFNCEGSIIESLTFQFTLNTTSSTYCSVLQFFSSTYKRFDTSVSAQITTNTLQTTITTGQSVSHAPSQLDPGRMVISITEWTSFDYVDLYLYLDVYYISSISANADGQSLPFTVSYLGAEGYTTNTYYPTIRVDLTGLDRSSTVVPTVVIEFDLKTNSTNYFIISDSYGYITSNSITSFSYYFSLLSNKLTSEFNNLRSTITDRLSILSNSLSTVINNFKSNLTSQLNQHTVDIISSISSWGQNIIDALNPNTNDADDVIDQVDQQASELQQGNEVLNNVAKPDLSGAGDISSIITPSNVASNTLFLTNLMSAPILSDVLLLSLIFALAGFVLFGKR